jgi:hypothetical protein
MAPFLEVMAAGPATSHQPLPDCREPVEPVVAPVLGFARAAAVVAARS